MKQINIKNMLLAIVFLFSASTVAIAQTTAVRDTQSTINEAADQAKKSQKQGQMMNMIASGALFAACAASCPSCRMELCAMGALAAIQGAKDGGYADQSGNTWDTSKLGDDYKTPDGTDDGDDDMKPGSVNDSTIKDGFKRLEEAGYKVTEAGVTLPDGTFQPASAFDSAQSMISAGMDPTTASLAAQTLSALQADLAKAGAALQDSGATVSGMAVDSGGGGGYDYGAGADGSGDNWSAMSKFKNPFDNKDAKKLLAGKSMMVAGEPIGVKGDNIFDMVHRAYQAKRKKSQFQETVGAGVRLPAGNPKGGL